MFPSALWRALTGTPGNAVVFYGLGLGAIASTIAWAVSTDSNAILGAQIALLFTLGPWLLNLYMTYTGLTKKR